jgi:hypothetical protein
LHHKQHIQDMFLTLIFLVFKMPQGENVMSKTIAIAAVVSLLSVSPTLAQSYTYVVHGIPGRDLGAAYSPSFPIDVSVDGTCIVKNAQFGNIIGPMAIPSGTVTVLAYTANATNPCSGPAILGTRAGVVPGQTISVVAGETINRALTFNPLLVDLTLVAPNSGRVVVYHQADAPTLDVVGAALTADQQNVTLSDIGLTGIQPGQGKAAAVQSGTVYLGRVTLPGAAGPSYGPPASVDNRAVEIEYLVGSAANRISDCNRYSNSRRFLISASLSRDPTESI